MAGGPWRFAVCTRSLTDLTPTESAPLVRAAGYAGMLLQVDSGPDDPRVAASINSLRDVCASHELRITGLACEPDSVLSADIARAVNLASLAGARQSRVRPGAPGLGYVPERLRDHRAVVRVVRGRGRTQRSPRCAPAAQGHGRAERNVMFNIRACGPALTNPRRGHTLAVAVLLRIASGGGTPCSRNQLCSRNRELVGAICSH